MAVFFSAQLDFIFFFYGLAFILLGSVCLAIASGGRQGPPWLVLGSFAFLHGAGEWLDLLALIVGDTPAFSVSRTALMAVSFMVLLEFARLEAVRLGLKALGRWIYVPLLLLVILGAFVGGLNGANAFARYAFGLTGATATSVVLAFYIKGASPAEERWIFFAVLGFALYAAAAGVIVPATSFWPGDVINYNGFVHLTGMPIQFVRGVLACWIAFAIWGFWGQRLMFDVASLRYSKFMQKQFVWTIVAMSTVLVFGWVLTEYLGGIYKQNVQEQALGDLDLIASRLAGETATVDGMVKALAGERSVRSLLVGDDKRDDVRVNSVLSLDTEVSGARDGYILDQSGTVVASYKRAEGARLGAENYGASPYFQKSMAGEAGYHFAVDAEGKERDYYVSYPVRGEDAEVVGVAVLKKSLDVFETDLRRFDRSFFLIDPYGIVVVTNRSNMLFRTLWPLSAGVPPALSRQFGMLNNTPMLAQEIVGSSWVMVDGARDYVQRRNINHSDWSLVTLTVPKGIFASRGLGIIITLQMATLALIYLVGRERRIHDNVQRQNRSELEDLARNLDYRAGTDPLTGLFNRRKFDQELAIEILRAQRYKTPLSLILYDIDYFKRINDTHGHQVGDKVLIDLSRFVSARIRQNDVLARWGGEEFVILVPESSAKMARELAENLCEAVQALIFDESITVTCSFGVAEFEIGDTTETLVARADAAMYRAKINGRNRVELAPRPAVVKSELEPAP